jgi:hypothetical protein
MRINETTPIEDISPGDILFDDDTRYKLVVSIEQKLDEITAYGYFIVTTIEDENLKYYFLIIDEDPRFATALPGRKMNMGPAVSTLPVLK